MRAVPFLFVGLMIGFPPSSLSQQSPVGDARTRSMALQLKLLERNEVLPCRSEVESLRDRICSGGSGQAANFEVLESRVAQCAALARSELDAIDAPDHPVLAPHIDAVVAHLDAMQGARNAAEACLARERTIAEQGDTGVSSDDRAADFLGGGLPRGDDASIDRVEEHAQQFEASRASKPGVQRSNGKSTQTAKEAGRTLSDYGTSARDVGHAPVTYDETEVDATLQNSIQAPRRVSDDFREAPDGSSLRGSSRSSGSSSSARSAPPTSAPSTGTPAPSAAPAATPTPTRPAVPSAPVAPPVATSSPQTTSAAQPAADVSGSWHVLRIDGAGYLKHSDGRGEQLDGHAVFALDMTPGGRLQSAFGDIRGVIVALEQQEKASMTGACTGRSVSQVSRPHVWTSGPRVAEITGGLTLQAARKDHACADQPPEPLFTELAGAVKTLCWQFSAQAIDASEIDVRMAAACQP